MTDKEILKKLADLEKLCNALDDEAKRRYGADGFLFFEADGSFHLMDGDRSPDAPGNRQEHARFTSPGYCRLGAGAW